ncbi:MAG TPA: WecB/TagA/CpsF family glycosyltransferase [Polyangiaceae bacterium]|nr:WecB/TagA/CpsF family glycosyltransferase [Polyangiaceae bacterium]
MAAPPVTPPASQKPSTLGGSATATRQGDVSEPRDVSSASVSGASAPVTVAVAAGDGIDSEAPRSAPGQFDTGLALIDLLGMSLARCSEPELLDALFAALEKQRGGWLITANLDFLRRYYKDPRMQVLYAQADLRVADGMPLVWAAYLQGTPLPERIAGSSLLKPLAERAAREGRSVYFLGGNGNSAEGASSMLRQEFPELRVAGFSSPWLPVEPDDAAVEPTRQVLTEARPDIVLVALGSPKQEWLISKLRRSLPAAWFVGVGMSFSFATGEMPRAPSWMQRSGLEWVHRLLSEPRRLGKRYLWHDAPFGIELLGRSLLARLERARRARA